MALERIPSAAFPFVRTASVADNAERVDSGERLASNGSDAQIKEEKYRSGERERERVGDRGGERDGVLKPEEGRRRRAGVRVNGFSAIFSG